MVSVDQLKERETEKLYKYSLSYSLEQISFITGLTVQAIEDRIASYKMARTA